jgi:hypothetical protein
MAEARDKSTPTPRRWVSLGEHLGSEAAQLGSKQLAKRLIRQALENGKPYRHRDAAGNFVCPGKHPPGYWLEGGATIDWDESYAKGQPNTLYDYMIHGPYGRPVPEMFSIEVEVETQEPLTAPSELSSPQTVAPVLTERLGRSVRTAESASIEGGPGRSAQNILKPVAQTSLESASDGAHESPPKPSRQRKKRLGPQIRRARTVLKRLYPDGYPTEEEVPTVDLLASFEAEYDRIEGQQVPPSALGMPSDRTVLREVGRDEG